MTFQEKIRCRQTANKAILLILMEVADAFPDWRLEQIICNLGLGKYDGTDKFYVESIDTLNELINHPIVYPLISDVLTKFMQSEDLEN